MAESTGASMASPATTKRETDIRQVAAAVASRFEVLEQVEASEAMALYLARDKKAPEVLVMLKLICGEALLDPRRLELFCREAEAASKLKHRNIVRASRALVSDGLHFMAIEHRPGACSLRSLLDRKGWLEPEPAARIACQIADALDYAHRAGVLHMNLHPDQILLDRDLNVLVSGFGIENREDLDWAHQERSRRMPARYISPEQARGERASPSGDLYSLGVVLFEMLTDRLPFNGASSDVIKRKHITQSPLPPYVFAPGVPRPLSEVTMKLLEKRPNGRFQSGAALVSVLSRLYAITPPAPERAPSHPVANARLAHAESQPEAEAPRQTAPEQTREAEPETRPEGEAAAPAIAMAPPEADTAQQPAAAEDDAPLEPDYDEHTPRDEEDRQLYETPAISAINQPVRQFYESAYPPDVATDPSGPGIQNHVAQRPAQKRRPLWLAAIVLAAIIIAAGGIVLARGGFLPGIFGSGAAEGAPATNPTNPEPGADSSRPAPPEGAEGNLGGGSTQNTLAPSGPQGAAPVIEKSEVKKPTRRSRSGTRRQRPARRAWY